ncbi:MAG TPA: hypothetical protein VFI06_01235 [Chitinophagaceae bacterium]|nr:hypothetical protein [Chitinophagaceae bacterium]
MAIERTLEKEELELLSCLLKAIGKNIFDLDKTKVIPLDDGGIGSLYIVHEKKEKDSRRFGAVLYEKEFLDTDRVPILIALNVDQDGDLFELDIWKVDFSPVKLYPRCDD